MPIVIGKTEIDVPLSELRFRRRSSSVYQRMIERGVNRISAIIASNRTNELSQQNHEDLFAPSIRNMQIWKLKDIDIAARRIAEARENDEIVGLVTDFDVDGISSAVVMKRALTEFMGFKKENVVIHVNNRMKYGYGFTPDALDAVMERSGDNLPTLLITADQGSNDSETIQLYKDTMEAKGFGNVDVIVTDHHHIKEGETCEAALAFVNPSRPDDEFEDPTICGCVVALLVMSAARLYMIKQNMLPKGAPRLSMLMTYACLATVADCVSLKSGYNRCIVRRGLHDINNEVIPAWTALKRKLNKPFAQVTATDLGFTLGPAINADSRTGGDGSDAVNFLMADNVDDAVRFYEKLKSRNDRRKEIDLSMQEAAFADVSKQYYEEQRRALVSYLPKGSHGIHGIVASRVKERFNCPVIIFSPVDVKEKDHPEKMITGSGRCIDNLSIVYMVLDRVGHLVKLKGGGHPAAMGLRMKLKDLPTFKAAFDEIVKEEGSLAGMVDGDFSPVTEIDHLFQDDDLSLLDDVNILQDIRKLEPYGIKFPEPIFAINGTLVDTTHFGKGVNQDAHLNLFFKDSRGTVRKVVCFHYKREPWIDELAVGEQYTFAVKLQYDSYERGLGMLVESVSPGINAVQKSK